MAARLAQFGVAHVVVDDAGPISESRATLVHTATLEILDEVGVAGELIAAGMRVNRIGFTNCGHVIASIGLAGVPSCCARPGIIALPRSAAQSCYSSGPDVSGPGQP